MHAPLPYIQFYNVGTYLHKVHSCVLMDPVAILRFLYFYIRSSIANGILTGRRARGYTGGDDLIR
jgi:hypothetical protein